MLFVADCVNSVVVSFLIISSFWRFVGSLLVCVYMYLVCYGCLFVVWLLLLMDVSCYCLVVVGLVCVVWIMFPYWCYLSFGCVGMVFVE